MFVKLFLNLALKSPDQLNWSGGFVCALFLFFSCSMSVSAASLSYSSSLDKKPAIIKNSLKKFNAVSAYKKISINVLNEDFNLSVEKPNSDLVVMSLHDLAERVPALQVLELPFFYNGLDDIHDRLDGEFGKQLQTIAQKNNWVILEWWDEGLHAMTGNRRYDQRINLSGMEFILLRDDPMAQLQFKSLNAWSRRVYPQSSQQLLHECVVGSRSATLAQIWSERLDRVHLSLSLNQSRYEGWVLMAPLSRWQALSKKEREQLSDAAKSMRSWQRDEALRLEKAALRNLQGTGMQVFEITAEQRQDFIKRLPAWDKLLPASLSAAEKKSLLSAATTNRISLAQ